jgi:hypothetical protein
MGPLKDLALQGSLIPQQIAEGMLKGKSHLIPAMQEMLSPIKAGTAGGNTFALQGGSSASGSGYTTANVYVMLDSRVLTEAVGVGLAKETRINGYRSR